MNNSVGDRIKYFRSRAGLSQLDLEVEMDASPGMISRIERGKVNPTKETILKIAEIVPISNRELLNLFSLDSTVGVESLRILDNALEISNREERIQFILNSVAKEYRCIVVSLFSLENERLQMEYMNDNLATKLSLKAIGKSVRDIWMNVKKDRENYILKSILEHKIYTSNNLFDFGRGAIPRQILIAIEEFTKMNYSISIPLSNKNRQYALYITKEYEYDYTFESSVLSHLFNVVLKINK